MTTIEQEPRIDSLRVVREAFAPALLPTTRLVSLDAYRGFVMLLMVSAGLGIATAEQRAQHARPFWHFLAGQVDHVQWSGCSLWDLIQPSFMFIVGVALPFSLAKRVAKGESFSRLLLHAVWRSLLLIWLGIFLSSIGKPQTNFTFENVLTQIGLGYTFLFLLAWTRPSAQLLAAVLILVSYWLAFAIFPLPRHGFDYSSVGVAVDWHNPFGLSGFAAHWDKNTNFAANFDVWFLNLFPRPQRFAFNAGGYLTLSFIPSLATMTFGLLAGELLRSNRPADRKFWILVACGFLGLILGTLFDRTGMCPIVKRIWTPAWTIYAGGWTCLLLAAFYGIVDWAGWRGWAFPLVVVGMNSIAIYCMSNAGFKGFVLRALRTHLGGGFFEWAGVFAPILESATVLLVLWLVCYWMYRRKIFLRI
jgi:heparan-alpha-glucosaminide N-acetyltransferase